MFSWKLESKSHIKNLYKLLKNRFLRSKCFPLSSTKFSTSTLTLISHFESYLNEWIWIVFLKLQNYFGSLQCDWCSSAISLKKRCQVWQLISHWIDYPSVLSRPWSPFCRWPELRSSLLLDSSLLLNPWHWKQ